MMRLSKDTLPSVLLIMIRFIEEKFIFDNTVDLDTTFMCVKIADQLKMRNLERELLTTLVMQMINKVNVIDYVGPAHVQVVAKKKMYRGEMVLVQPENSDDSDEERKRKRRMRR